MSSRVDLNHKSRRGDAVDTRRSWDRPGFTVSVARAQVAVFSKWFVIQTNHIKLGQLIPQLACGQRRKLSSKHLVPAFGKAVSIKIS